MDLIDRIRLVLPFWILSVFYFLIPFIKDPIQAPKVFIYIDNQIPAGDSIISIKNFSVGPASTITGSFILNSILIELAVMLKNEKIFPFYISSNMPNASINNNKLEKKFKKINPHL